NTNLTIDFGGGLKSEEAIKMAFELGAKQVSLGSIAVKSPELVEGWIEQFGPDKIILGADVDNGKIAVNGWQEITQIELEGFVNKYQQKGIRNVICTDISRDGTLEGSAIALYQQLINQFPKINWIASGGVTSFEELGLLAKAGLEGAIIGKAIYENRIRLKQLEAYVD
ncbi:MAG: 1-(5-phosphoribosyl)-5-[(5-phosphoribosylamino)methylideneamino]imidazole-4-carboxamide isomerase, partial [Cyclobacteriaceae bacterium]|nr:1-(5-phosphoribosyl)-5-[(5-phosphoribosylamino)methylideneamino]imidazole-4-carboxamide isomerase [Cyclobacteriaceae bacterium]